MVCLFGCLCCLIGLIIDTVCWLQCFVVLDCVVVCLFSGYEYCVGSVGCCCYGVVVELCCCLWTVSVGL